MSNGLVFWRGTPPSDAEKVEFRNRGLQLRVVRENENTTFAGATGLVCSASPPYFQQIRRHLSDLGDALNHGLLIYLLADDDTTHAYLESNLPERLRDAQFKTRIRRRTAIPPYECAEAMARHSPGRALNATLEIRLPSGSSLPAHEEFLFGRAFSDCTAVEIKQMDGGRSAAAYEVHATLKHSDVGPRPMPFFAKVDTAQKVEDEKRNYESYAAQHIPWNKRPNIDLTRCVTGTEHGILVGSFVDRSESLWAAVQDRRGPSLIDSLFDDTLSGWRRQAYRKEPQRVRVANALPQVFDYLKVRPEHLRQAAEFGLVRPPQELSEDLFKNLQPVLLRRAPMHGDMHGLNVRVRDNDAIIIDLAKTQDGPLSADLASLDVWLAFEVPDAVPSRQNWLSLVKDLYCAEGLLRIPADSQIHDEAEWLRGSIRKIRMHAAAACEVNDEYGVAIALYLLRRSCHEARRNVDEDSYRRAAAYWLGSQLVSALAAPNRLAA